MSKSIWTATIDCIIYKQEKFLIVLEAGKYNTRVPEWSGSGEGILSGTDCKLLAVFSQGRKDKTL